MKLANNAMQRNNTTSTAMFNQAFDIASEKFRPQVEAAVKQGLEKPQSHSDLHKLHWNCRMTYLNTVRRLVANQAVKVGHDPVRLRAIVEEVRKYHEFNAYTADLMQTRMGWSSRMELPLMRINNGDTFREISDVSQMLDVLSDKYDYERFIVGNSSEAAIVAMQPLAALVKSDGKMAWEQLEMVVRKRAQHKFEKGKATKTDKVILRQEEYSVFMLTHVCSRYLSALLGATEYTARQLSYRIEAMEKAVTEALGNNADSVGRKVGGYTDLSSTDSGGYCDPSQVDSIRQNALDGDDEKGIVGITELQDRLDGFELIEAELLRLIHECRKRCADVNMDIPNWAYLYVVQEDGSFLAIQDRDVALQMKAEMSEQRRARNAEMYATQREDEARYHAQMMRAAVPTFEMSFGYDA